MNDQHTYQGSCFCHAVEFTVTGKPVAMGYCHCESCRHWSAGPVNAFTLWHPEAVQITRGSDQIGSYSRTSHSLRKWCKLCGGHVFSEHPEWKLIDVFTAAIPDFPFKPGIHVHYQESVLQISDGLPKFKDIPKEMGGSGIIVEE
ncbi:MAG: GFA family protein [Nitrosomonas sp.]|nr:MAG: GFA family protein [Nitrosomonas sp.]